MSVATAGRVPEPTATATHTTVCSAPSAPTFALIHSHIFTTPQRHRALAALANPIHTMCIAGGSTCSTVPCLDVAATANAVLKKTNSTTGFAKAKGEQLATRIGSATSKAAVAK
jgi:hypothetical protein